MDVSEMKINRLAIIVILAVVGLCSCKTTEYVPVETVRYSTDTLRTVQVRWDSVFMHDSVAVIQRGDTVFQTRYRDRMRFRDRIDTVYRAVIDTVSIEVPYPVKKQLSWWEQTKMDFGGMAMGGLLIALCIAVLWLIKKFRK